ncbi:MAG TPA: peptide ABC transporter substrate-binding protein [Patescibacteria group bacterium]|nr:peptide ABC transporter substrate-binding protein [Patescibacteria group bacterium]
MNGFPENFISYTKDVSLGAKELKHLNLSLLRKVFSLMGKREKIACTLLAALAVFSLAWSLRSFYLNHTVAVAADGGSYSEGLLGQPTYLNPLLARQDPDLTLTRLIFSGLYKYNAAGQLVPDLADGLPQISDDQKQYTVSLRRDAKWQNGKPVTADDVIFTIQTLQDPDYKSPLRASWQATTVDKLSDYTVRFTTKDISGPFLDNLTLPILPKNIWGKVDAQNFLLSKSNLEAVGSGPYAVKEIKKLPSGKIEQISLAANSDYYAGRPKIDELDFVFYDTEDDMANAFHSREISGFGYVPLSSSLDLGRQRPGPQSHVVPLPQYQIVFFNLNSPILGDQSVRAALALATDKQQIIDQVFDGQALLPNSPLMFNGPDNISPTSSPADLEQAQSLLDSAGWKIDPKTNLRSGKKGALTLTIATNDSAVNSKAADLLAEQWRKLNITVNLSVLPGKQLTDSVIRPRTFDVLLFQQKYGADPDPFLFWHSSQVKDPGFNLTGLANPAIDKLITDARTTTDRTVREQKYQQFSQQVLAQTPVIFLNQTELVYNLDDEVKNAAFQILYDPSQRFSDVADWYVKTKRVWK